jgi:uncharacterized protein (TIGR01244 family)
MMTDPRQVSAKVAVGGQPTEDEIRELRERGFATIVNLRLAGEAGQPLDPAAEGAAAAAAGLGYHHIPVSLAELDPARIDQLRAAIDGTSGPVYVHCAAGQRACSFSLLATSVTVDGGADLVARAAELGFPVTDARLAGFVSEQAERERLRLLQAI